MMKLEEITFQKIVQMRSLLDSSDVHTICERTGLKYQQVNYHLRHFKKSGKYNFEVLETALDILKNKPGVDVSKLLDND